MTVSPSKRRMSASIARLVAVAALAAVLLFSAPQAANKTTSAIKNAAHKKRFNAKTPP